MNKVIVRNALICISKMKIEDTTYCVARDIIVEEYKTQQQEIEKLNNIINKAIEVLKDTNVNETSVLLITSIDYAIHILKGE